jgi:hypothetical protein
MIEQLFGAEAQHISSVKSNPITRADHGADGVVLLKPWQRLSERVAEMGFTAPEFGACRSYGSNRVARESGWAPTP